MNDNENNDDDKNFKLRDLLNKKNIPTAYALFAAFGLITTLKDGGNLAKFIVDSLDSWMQALARFISSYLPAFFEPSLIVELIYLSALLYFSITGLSDLIRKKKLFTNDLDVYISCACNIFVYCMWVMKFGHSEVDFSFILMAFYSSFFMGGIAYFIYFVLSYVFRSISQNVIYLIAMTICLIGIESHTLYRQIYLPGLMQYFPSMIFWYSLVTVCILMFSLNPKRIRQVTFLIFLLLGLSYISIPLNNFINI